MDDMTNEFYVDDEPIEDVRAIVAAGGFERTRRPWPAGAVHVHPIASVGVHASVTITRTLEFETGIQRQLSRNAALTGASSSR